MLTWWTPLPWASAGPAPTGPATTPARTRESAAVDRQPERRSTRTGWNLRMVVSYWWDNTAIGTVSRRPGHGLSGRPLKRTGPTRDGEACVRSPLTFWFLVISVPILGTLVTKNGSGGQSPRSMSQA